METDRFRDGDTREFLCRATGEGWISDELEIAFLRKTFPQGCLVKRVQGFPVAFITAIRYDRSGWIGNLLVHPDLRRRRLGAELMTEASAALENAGVETVWLTASSSGKPLYERLGFQEIDTVRRWKGRGMETCSASSVELSAEELVMLDAAGWGDRRETLVSFCAQGGTVCSVPGAFLMVRPADGMCQIGSWGGVSSIAIVELFEQTVRMSSSGGLLCLDVPAGNEVVSHHLERRGFTDAGSNVLMFRGKPPAYHPNLIGSLASMGSMG
jgi:GNAT superfamily N-acetyltransferase